MSSLHHGPAEDYTQTTAYKLLAENPNARVIVNLHGNAAHIGTGFRPNIYRNMVSISTAENPVHVIAFDYRGFGLSTGTPTEEGLITDAETVIAMLTAPPLSIPRSRIVITGQSLGTAVAAGVAERLIFTPNDNKDVSKPYEPFAGIFLFAPFRNIPILLDSYSFMGVFPPILSPLLGYPRFKTYITDNIVDTWNTAGRLARLSGIAPKTDEDAHWADKDFDLTVFHARDDLDIPWREGRRAYDVAIGGDKASDLGTFTFDHVSEDKGREVKVWERVGADGKGRKRFSWQRVKYGGKQQPDPFAFIARYRIVVVWIGADMMYIVGHNEIAAQPPAALAVRRAFDGQ